MSHHITTKKIYCLTCSHCEKATSPETDDDEELQRLAEEAGWNWRKCWCPSCVQSVGDAIRSLKPPVYNPQAVVLIHSSSDYYDRPKLIGIFREWRKVIDAALSLYLQNETLRIEQWVWDETTKPVVLFELKR